MFRFLFLGVGLRKFRGVRLCCGFDFRPYSADEQGTDDIELHFGICPPHPIRSLNFKACSWRFVGSYKWGYTSPILG